MILGANAKDEDHLVTVTAENCVGEELTHPLCWLSRKSVSESQCSMHMALPPPVTLKLVQGSGPVHVIGVWEQQLEDDAGFGSEDEGDVLNDTMGECCEDKPLKDVEGKQKKRPASSPPPKPSKVAKKDDKISKSSSQKKPALMTEQDSEEEDEDEDEEGEDSEQDEEDGDDDEDDEEEEESDEEEESEDEPSPPPKKKFQTKVITPKQKANTPKSIGDKAAKKPHKGTPQGSRSLEELKAMISKSPNVPKKREKFNNYLQNNLKVTDPDVRNKLWNFVQQSKH